MQVLDAEEISGGQQKRCNDGGVYLVVADETAEFDAALRYAARRAKAARAYIGILQIIHIDDFQHWSNVETMMRAELRARAEKFIWGAAKKVNALTGDIPALYIREGVYTDIIHQVIDEDHTIRALILGGGTGGAGPGALVTYFTGKGLSKLRVPVVIVPGNLDPAAIDIVAA